MPVSDAHKLGDKDELLLRQVIAIWVEEGRPVSRAFRPNTGDGGQLSSDRNSMVTPREAYEAYLEKQRNSGGVWGLTVGEYAADNLSTYADPVVDNTAHAVVDFAPHAEKEWRRLSKRLHAHAVRRGRLYPAEEVA
jgi:hypothetical protein